MLALEVQQAIVAEPAIGGRGEDRRRVCATYQDRGDVGGRSRRAPQPAGVPFPPVGARRTADEEIRMDVDRRVCAPSFPFVSSASFVPWVSIFQPYAPGPGVLLVLRWCSPRSPPVHAPPTAPSASSRSPAIRSMTASSSPGGRSCSPLGQQAPFGALAAADSASSRKPRSHIFRDADDTAHDRRMPRASERTPRQRYRSGRWAGTPLLARAPSVALAGHGEATDSVARVRRSSSLDRFHTSTLPRPAASKPSAIALPRTRDRGGSHNVRIRRLRPVGTPS